MTERQPDMAGPLGSQAEEGNGSESESESDLELLAIEDHFAEALRSGAAPRLADYLRRYPRYASQLTEFASLFLPEAAREAGGAMEAHSAYAGGEEQELAEPEEPGKPGKPGKPGLSPGTRHALDTILAGLDSQTSAGEALLVAEEPAAYTTQPVEWEETAEVAGVPLAALAQQTGLRPGELVELARAAAHTPETVSPTLVRRVAEALGIPEAEALRALAGEGESS